MKVLEVLRKVVRRKRWQTRGKRNKLNKRTFIISQPFDAATDKSTELTILCGATSDAARFVPADLLCNY